MRFAKGWTEFVRPLGGSVWRPTLDVGVAVTTGWETHRFLVDSGAGEVFSVVRPEMSKETERRVREAVREILVEEGLI